MNAENSFIPLCDCVDYGTAVYLKNFDILGDVKYLDKRHVKAIQNNLWKVIKITLLQTVASMFERY